MKTSVIKAIQLILSMDAELLDILGITAEMSLQSSILALLIGLPIGILLGSITERTSEILTEEINYMRPVQYFWEEFVN